MKSSVIKTAARIGVVVVASYLFKLHDKSMTGGNDSTIKTKSGDEKKEEIEESESDIIDDTDEIALFKIYDSNSELFLYLYNKYMNDELSGPEAAKLLGCAQSTFYNAVKYYRNLENINETKPRTNRRLAKYTICDKKPEEFLHTYNRFKNKEINSREAAKELNIATSTFYRSVKYYESKNGGE